VLTTGHSTEAAFVFQLGCCLEEQISMAGQWLAIADQMLAFERLEIQVRQHMDTEHLDGSFSAFSEIQCLAVGIM
jgi:hypothetical protein